MTRRRFIIRHGGRWLRSDYVEGDEQLVFLSVDHLDFDSLMVEIHEIMQTDPSSVQYLLYYMSTSINDSRRIKASLKDDSDLMELLREQTEEVVIFLTERVYSGPRSSRVRPSLDPRTIADDFDPDFDPVRDDDPPHETPSTEEEADEEADENDRSDVLQSLLHEFCGWVRGSGRLGTLSGMTGGRLFHGASTSSVGDTPRIASNNWVVPLADLDAAGSSGWVEPSSRVVGTLSVGSVFGSKEELAIAVGIYHMQNRVEYAVYRSNQMRLNYICKHADRGCGYKLGAVAKGGIWRIYRHDNSHTCVMDMDRIAPRTVPAKVIAKYFARKVVGEKKVLRPREMMSELQREYGIQIDYSYALRARNIAVEMIYGGYEESYSRLPAYLHMVQMANPGTLYDIDYAPDGLFRHMFIAIGACVKAFVDGHTRPVIVIDGTHLKGKSKGIMFVAVTKDGNENVLPLAVGIGPIENDESWCWFLSHVRSAFGAPSDLLIVSDQHPSIKNAVQAIFPGTTHGLCYYHLLGKMAKHGQHVASMFNEAAYTYRDEVLQRNLSALQLVSPDGAYKRLEEIGAPYWSRSRCPVRRYSFMTSNAAETLNSRMVWGRRLPVCSLLDVYRSVVEDWFRERLEIARAARVEHHVMCPEAGKRLKTITDIGRTFEKVRGTTLSSLWKVEGHDKIDYMVDLQNRTCDCHEFDLDLMPCVHAAAAIRNAGYSVYDFVSRWYKNESHLAIYDATIMSVPPPEQWFASSYFDDITIRAPIIVRHAGRPPTRRHRAGYEGTSGSRAQTCTRCGANGHNRRGCTSYLPISGVDEAGSSSTRTRAQKKCSICGDIGHTRPRCPSRPET